MTLGKKIAGGVAASAAIGAALVSQLVTAGPKTIRIAWDLEPSALSNYLVSVVESRTNLPGRFETGGWQVRTQFAYRAGSNTVLFIMDKPKEFFRVGFKFK